MAADDASHWETSVAVVTLLGFIFFGTAVYAFVWSRRQKQFDNLEEGSRSIFDKDEPEGRVTDTFPDDQDKPSRG